MKKYLIEPYVEQTYSAVLGQNVSNTTDVTRSASSSFGVSDSNPLSNSSLLSGSLNVDINDSKSQIITLSLLNGASEKTTTSNYYSKYVNPISDTSSFYPIGTDNTPTTKSYKIAPTEPVLLLPMKPDNTFTYFIIAIIIIFLILIILYFFVL